VNFALKLMLADRIMRSKDGEAKALLEAAPSDFDVNWINEKDYAKRGLLHVACQHNRHSIVAELLKHPMINPHKRS